MVTNANYGSGTLSAIGPFTPQFPTVKFIPTHGLGDYVGIVRRGIPGGTLFPSWAEPIVTTGGGCSSCLGSSYGERVMGVTVTP